MITKLITTIAVCLLLTSTQTQSDSCVPVLQAATMLPTKFGKLETGIFDFVYTSPMSRYNYIQVPYKETHDEKNVEVGLSIIYMSNYFDANGVDFSIRPILKGSAFTALFTVSPTARWLRTHVHYIASSRDDFKCGFFPAYDTNLLEPSPTQRRFRVYRQLPNFALINPDVKMIVFASLSGIKSEETSFSLKVAQEDTVYMSANRTMAVALYLSGNKKPIEYVFVSYYAYTLYGAYSIGKNPISGFDFIYDSIANNTANSIEVGGMTGINGDNLGKLLSARSSNTKRLLVATAQGVPVDPLSLPQHLVDPVLGRYVASLDARDRDIYRQAFEVVDFGVMINNVNMAPILFDTEKTLSQELQNLIKKNACFTIDMCTGSKGQMTMLKNGTQRCVLCSGSKIFSPELEQCVCPDNFVLVNNKCTEPSSICGSGEGNLFKKGACFQLVKTKNICQGEHYTFDEKLNACACEQEYTQINNPNSASKICVPKCPQLSTFNSKTLECDCPKGQYLVGSSCRPCGLMQEWSDTQKKCVCKPNSTTVNGQCSSCSPYSKFITETRTCKCNTGYSGNGVVCRPVRIGGGAIIIGST